MADAIEKYNSPVARNVRRVIQDRCLKQSAVAEKAGITIQSFSDMLNGRKVMKATDIQAIANALKVDVNELFARTEKEVG